MDCEEVRGRFSEFLEKELNPLEEESIRAHLASCPECGKDYDRFVKTIHWLHSVGEEEVPVDLASGIHKRIEDRKAGLERRWYERPLRFKIPIQAVAMVAVVVLVVYLTKMTPPSYVEEARDVKGPQSRIGVTEPEQEQHESMTPPAPPTPGRKTSADRPAEEPSTGPSALSSRPKGPGPKRVEGPPAGPVEPLRQMDQARPQARGSERLAAEALVEKQPEAGLPVPLEARDEEMKAAKEKPLPAEKPIKEFALRIPDREKALSFLHEVLGRYGGKVVTAEGDTVLASLPAASFSGFAEEMTSFSDPGTDEVFLFKKGIRAAGEPPEAKKEQAGKVLTGRDDTVTLRIRLFTE